MVQSAGTSLNSSGQVMPQPKSDGRTKTTAMPHTRVMVARAWLDVRLAPYVNGAVMARYRSTATAHMCRMDDEDDSTEEYAHSCNGKDKRVMSPVEIDQ